MVNFGNNFKKSNIKCKVTVKEKIGTNPEVLSESVSILIQIASRIERRKKIYNRSVDIERDRGNLRKKLNF